MMDLKTTNNVSFPGFVYLYRDNDNLPHLFFFSGLSNDNEPIYRNIDFTGINFKYDIRTGENFIDYKFENKSINQISCNLIPFDQDKFEEKNIILKI